MHVGDPAAQENLDTDPFVSAVGGNRLPELVRKVTLKAIWPRLQRRLKRASRKAYQVLSASCAASGAKSRHCNGHQATQLIMTAG